LRRLHAKTPRCQERQGEDERLREAQLYFFSLRLCIPEECYAFARVLCVLFFAFSCITFSCTRNTHVEAPAFVTWSGAYPMAILQPGTQPLWFEVTEDGPIHITSIEDVASVYAFIPWPYAVHISSMEETKDGIIAVVNKDGFLKINLNDGKDSGLALYHFSGGHFWRPYTVGGFINYDNNPTALLYLDERFFSSDEPLPLHRTWSFNMNANVPFPLDIPVFQFFPADEGWDIDTLRLANDGLYYYRAARRSGASPLVRMFRADNLEKLGEEIPIETFYNSAPRLNDHSHPALPVLPNGFIYTGVGRVGNALFASWEEQEDFSIAAAGFVILKY